MNVIFFSFFLRSHLRRFKEKREARSVQTSGTHTSNSRSKASRLFVIVVLDALSKKLTKSNLSIVTSP